MMKSIAIRSEATELTRLRGWVDAYAAEVGLDDDSRSRVHVILDELVTNLFKYGYDDGVIGNCEVTLERRGDCLNILVRDDGRPFDPLNADAPDLDLSVDDRPVGGLGLYLIRSMISDGGHERDGAENILRLTLPLVGS
jgi:anti-sigma regulatory factor (Ser/Thr protein kinase)